jgi:hypothetical protein
MGLQDSEERLNTSQVRILTLRRNKTYTESLRVRHSYREV